MKTKIITYTPENIIGESAKICYASKLIEDGGKDITNQLVHGYGHLAVLRFAFVVVDIKNISRACSDQVVRSKHLDFLVQSMRYVSANKMQFIMPEGLDPNQQELMKESWDQAIKTYEELINNKVKKEDARAVLPMNTSTNMRVSGNLQAWMDFFKLRLTSHAQYEIRELAKDLYSKFAQLYPQVFTEKLYDNLTKE